MRSNVHNEGRAPLLCASLSIVWLGVSSLEVRFGTTDEKTFRQSPFPFFREVVTWHLVCELQIQEIACLFQVQLFLPQFFVCCPGAAISLRVYVVVDALGEHTFRFADHRNIAGGILHPPVDDISLRPRNITLGTFVVAPTPRPIIALGARPTDGYLNADRFCSHGLRDAQRPASPARAALARVGVDAVVRRCLS